MSGPFELTLGLDLRPQTTGAVAYALWMCRTAGLMPAGHVRSIHVIEPAAMLELIRYADEPTIFGAFRQRGKEVLDEVARDAHLHPPEVLAGDAVELLGARAFAENSTALLIARRAKASSGVVFQRLGAVARRLLRKLEVPIIVAPPDLLASTVGGGPVIVAVDFEDSSARAVAWAKPIADTLHRKLLLVHLAEIPDQIAYAGIIQSERWDTLSTEILDRGRERMAAFLRKHAIEGVETAIVRGPVLPGLVDYAAHEQACLLVCGSGHHGVMHRIMVPSVASESAALAAVAVAVVP